MINLATVFSGIGAPEEALKQMHKEFNIVFACDNGERELDIGYEEIIKITKSMPEQEKWDYINNLYEETGKPNYVKESYFANYDIDESRWYEDVRFIDGNKYKGKVDILVGGSPCQSFSTYGKKQGFEDTRGTLFFFYANLINTVRPKVFIYENVPGLKSHNKGYTWARIQEVFKELDYDVYTEELNAIDYGLPQNRKRVFVVGFDKKYGINNYKFPQKIKLNKKASNYLETDVPLKYYLGKKGFEWLTTKEKHKGRSRFNRDIIGCQTANQQFNWTGDLLLESPTDEMRENKLIYIGIHEGEEKVARKMTPMECLKLMGFKKFNIVVQDKEAYRQSGNSIAVPVLKKIFSSIIKTMNFD